jgi:hypothetical protein
MAMRQQLWSINALSTELEVDRRTLATALKGIAPDGQLGSGKRKHDAWRLLTALTALGWGRDAIGGDGESYVEARRRWMNARAATAQHEAARAAREAALAAGELVPIGPVSEARGLQFKLIANHLMRLPASLPPLLVGQSAPKIQTILKVAVYEALQQIADCEIRVPPCVGSAVQHFGPDGGSAKRAQEGEPTTDTDGL